MDSEPNITQPRSSYLERHAGYVSNPPSLHKWVDQLGTKGCRTLATVLGPTPSFRSGVYRLTLRNDLYEVVLDDSRYCYDWQEGAIVDNLSKRLAVQRILRGLVESEDLPIEEEVLEVIDHGLCRVHEGFKALWEIRYLYNEGEIQQVDMFLQALTQWSRGYRLMSVESTQLLQSIGIQAPIESVHERYDMLMFWLTLAKFAHQFDRLILPFDGAHKTAHKSKEITALIEASERWGNLGSPLGIMLGFANTVSAFTEYPSVLRGRFRTTLV